MSVMILWIGSNSECELKNEVFILPYILAVVQLSSDHPDVTVYKWFESLNGLIRQVK